MSFRYPSWRSAIRSRDVLRIAVGLLIGSASISAVHAQVVSGTVADSTSGRPVGAGFVVLLDADNREVARSLTDQSGGFTLQAPRPGTYRLRSERIGYRPWTSGDVRLDPGATLTFTLRVSALPVRLSTIDVRSESDCQIRPEVGRSTAVLWEEIRKALSGATWSASGQRYRQTFVRFERDFDRRRRRVQRETMNTRSGWYQEPFSSLPATELSERGWVHTDRSGDTWYYAPDAAVILEDAFLAEHCFQTVRGRGEQDGWLGLEFRPIDERDRDRTDVRGVLWVDAETAELRRIDYGYVDLPGRVRDDRIGGSIEFIRLPAGAWVVNRWTIRTPVLGGDRSPRTGQIQYRVEGFRDTGGEIVRVVDTNGEVVYEAPMAVLSGSVFDSVRQRELAGAVVEVVGTPFVTVADRRGRFRVEAPLEGRYGVTFSHPRTDSLGVEIAEQEVQLDRGDSVVVAMAVPTLATIIDTHCGGLGERERVIVGAVRRGAVGGQDLEVEFQWQQIRMGQEASEIAAREMGLEVEVGSDDRYLACGLPVGRPIAVRVQAEWFGERVTVDSLGIWFDPDRPTVEVVRPLADTEVYFVAEPIWKLDLRLTPPRRDPQPR